MSQFLTGSVWARDFPSDMSPDLVVPVRCFLKYDLVLLPPSLIGLHSVRLAPSVHLVWVAHECRSSLRDVSAALVQ